MSLRFRSPPPAPPQGLSYRRPRPAAPDPQPSDEDIVTSRQTRDLAIITELEQSTQASYQAQMSLMADYRERTDLIRKTLKHCRELRMMMVFVSRGAVSSDDRSKHRPPVLRSSADGGVADAAEYIDATLDRLAEMMASLHRREAVMTRATVGVSQTAAARTQDYVEAMARDDDELTIVSSWNRFTDGPNGE